MYETLYNIATEQQCELTICMSVRQEHFYQEVKQPTPTLETIKINDRTDRLTVLDREFNNAVWNKLYSRRMLVDNDIFFPAGTYYEDILFTNLLLHYCTKICITNQILYHHITQSSSISNNHNPEERFQYIEVIMMLIEELRARGLYQDYAEFYENYFVMQYITFMTNFESLFGEMNADLFAVFKQSIFELFPNFLGIPIVRLLSENGNAPKSQYAIKRILEDAPIPRVSKMLVIKGQSRYDVLRYFSDALIESFRKKNIEVDVFDASDDSTLQAQSNHCRAQSYDFVLSLNGVFVNALDVYLHNRNTLFWSFLVDHPYYHHYRLLEPHINHLASCVDRNHVTYAKSHYPGLYQTCYLPHGGNLPNHEPQPYTSRKYPVTFMGSYGNPEEVAASIDQLPELVRMIAINVINRYYETCEESIESLFQSEFAKYQLTFSDEEFAGVMNELTIVDKYIRLKNREQLLHHLTSHHITVDVFGAGWENYQCKNSEYLNIHNQVGFTEALDIMCDSQIVLNALPLFLDGSHERVFTSMLCGAVCMSEENAYLKEEFEDGENICFFHMKNLDKMVSDIQSLLSDNRKAETIANAGRQLALEKHTWDTRAQMILDTVEEVLKKQRTHQ